jgi:hypothetical protein
MSSLRTLGISRTPTSKEAVQRLWKRCPRLGRLETFEAFFVK